MGCNVEIDDHPEYFPINNDENPAQCLVLTAAKLLTDDAVRAKKVTAEAKPPFKSKEEYLAAIDSLTMNREAVTYNEDGTFTLSFSN